MSEIVDIAHAAVSRKLVGAPLVSHRVLWITCELPARAVAALRRHGWLTHWTTAANWVPARPALIAAQKTIDTVVSEVLEPATGAELRKAVAILTGSWPHACPPDPDVYVAGMMQELRGYSPAVLSIAISRARRTLQWLPSIAHMVQLCDVVVAEFTRLKRVGRDVEHRREELQRVAEENLRRVRREIWLASFHGEPSFYREPDIAIAASPEDLALAAGLLEMTVRDLLRDRLLWPDLTDAGPIVRAANMARAEGRRSRLRVDERE